MTNDTYQDRSGQPQDAIWFAVRVIEFTLILLVNALTLVIFARSHHLRKRTTYLIINLTVADLLVGVVSGPLELLFIDTRIEPGDGWKYISIVTFYEIFPLSSLCNLTLISLERLHATLFPFRHCLIQKSVYFKVIISSWLLSFLFACMCSILTYEKCTYMWAIYIILNLLVLTYCYVVITVKVRRYPSGQPCGALVSDRKLSVTLFIVTVVFILTVLPSAIYFFFPQGAWNELPKRAQLDISRTVYVLYYACSLVNPLIYAIRMQSFRNKVYKQLICWKTLEPSRLQPVELHVM